jgi:GMP synthase-like glutamine amidotransferase
MAAMALRVALVDCGSRKVPELAAMLEQAGARCCRMALADVRAAALGASEALVISGGPRLFTSEPDLGADFAFLEGLELPMLGICLGHQAIGLRHGAQAFLGEARRGPELVELVADHPLLDGLGRSISLGADHCEGINLPEGFDLLASSRHYRVEIMASRTAAVFGIQCHPEISGETGARLLANFVALARSGPSAAADSVRPS